MTLSPGLRTILASGLESVPAPLIRAPSPFPSAFFAIAKRGIEGGRQCEVRNDSLIIPKWCEP